VHIPNSLAPSSGSGSELYIYKIVLGDGAFNSIIDHYEDRLTVKALSNSAQEFQASSSLAVCPKPVGHTVHFKGLDTFSPKPLTIYNAKGQ
jgi:Zn-dependent membrane protease YugP